MSVTVQSVPVATVQVKANFHAQAAIVRSSRTTRGFSLGANVEGIPLTIQHANTHAFQEEGKYVVARVQDNTVTFFQPMIVTTNAEGAVIDCKVLPGLNDVLQNQLLSLLQTAADMRQLEIGVSGLRAIQ
jgi:hypothetical protein